MGQTKYRYHPSSPNVITNHYNILEFVDSAKQIQDWLHLAIDKEAWIKRESLQNYRPVQNLSFLSKVIELVVAQQLTAHMRENNLHEQMQSEYRKNH